jgi:hypothetical protein
MKKIIFIFSICISYVFTQHFNVEIAESGESTLFIFEDTISSLVSGDEIGLFDSNGILDSDGNTGEILVGAGIWDGEQLTTTAIGSIDLSAFGGPILPGSVSGNGLTLKAWLVAEDQEYDVTYDISSGTGTFNGLFTAINEIDLPESPGDEIEINVLMSEGWNWMSLNVSIDDMSLNTVLETLDDNAIYIKSQTGFADYYSGFGWYGTLEDIDNISMYKLNMGAQDNIVLTGIPVDIASTVFDLAEGWNWIGYAPQIILDLNTALFNIPDGNAIYIKSQTGFADYYSGFGWYGTLEEMDPFVGYLLNMSTSTTFIYNEDE